MGTANTGRIIQAALAGLAIIWRDGFRYKKSGVMLLDLAPASFVAAALFDQPDDARSLARMRTLDTLNACYGRSMVTFGATGRRRGWTMRRDLLSPCYTTDWDEPFAFGEHSYGAAIDGLSLALRGPPTTAQ